MPRVLLHPHLGSAHGSFQLRSLRMADGADEGAGQRVYAGIHERA